MLTRSGLVTAVFALVMLAAGAAADYPELVAFGIAAVVALVVAVLSMLVRPNLDADRVIRPDRATEGEQALALLTVHNLGRVRTPPLAVVESINGEAFAVDVPSLAAGGSHEHRYALPSQRRGRHEIAQVEIGHSDPLRLLRSSARTGSSSVLVVHPRTHHLGVVSRGGPRDSEGLTSSVSALGGLAFHSLREYEHGDDYRLIHWRSTARAGKLMVRHHVIPDEPRHLVVLDVDAGSYPDGRFEDAVRAAASLVRAACRAGLPLELRTTAEPAGERGTADQWTSDELSALDRLAEARLSEEDRDLADQLANVVSSTEGVSLAVVTGQPPAGRLDVITALRPRFLSVSLVTFGSPQPSSAGMVLVDARDSADFASQWNELMSR
ncbi:DUF58 domain-containing protein [Lentzea sp. BCCO 10_0061]|uniref:DUF58 domain-containing protein n=1 Tax=Lentzea sokolovensis TaxID=3095429 RepID=A0ABU4V7P5_9PSEU|nr:DUF58 domain-containing protein [Lentzea sp. BCCO 10_0061]MDX8147823.1 DUF58 domain-containing protein [Lentzea sp. BCCO 10_0061]